MIISFIQTKGGTGKSTLALNTAFSKVMRENFSSVALVELDPQGTLESWWKEREENGFSIEGISFHHISSTQKEVIQEGIKSISVHNQLVILDTPGESVSKLHTRFACAFSDMVIIPMRTSTNDEAAFADNLLPIIKEIIKNHPEKRNSFFVLPSFTYSQTSKKKVLDYFSDILPDYIHCLDAVYPSRGIYENFNRDGMNLYDYFNSVQSNKKLTTQAEKALQDVEEIAKTIVQEVEYPHGDT
ncbi:MAG: ParA family protein [Leptospiraceae bacterium]|nr:ParA family protein [Leptospiraceae bacterium]MCP5500677.1 ParA family protein [Leptospiraceae bacterium]